MAEAKQERERKADPNKGLRDELEDMLDGVSDPMLHLDAIIRCVRKHDRKRRVQVYEQELREQDLSMGL